LVMWAVGGGVWLLFFFFQAEDGIRDWSVTGVQTCALPISGLRVEPERPAGGAPQARVTGKFSSFELVAAGAPARWISGHVDAGRSEERRVGKEWRSGWWRVHENKKVRVMWRGAAVAQGHGG